MLQVHCLLSMFKLTEGIHTVTPLKNQVELKALWKIGSLKSRSSKITPRIKIHRRESKPLCEMEVRNFTSSPSYFTIRNPCAACSWQKRSMDVVFPEPTIPARMTPSFLGESPLKASTKGMSICLGIYKIQTILGHSKKIILNLRVNLKNKL